MIVHMIHILFNIVLNFFFYDSLKRCKVKFNEHWIWLDGCARQFKSSRSFFWLCRLHKALNIKHGWNFFETGHGKGEHDCAGACVKRALQRCKMNHSSRQFHSTAEVFQRCKSNLSHDCSQQSKDVHRYVHYFFNLY